MRKEEKTWEENTRMAQTGKETWKQETERGIPWIMTQRTVKRMGEGGIPGQFERWQVQIHTRPSGILLKIGA